MPSATGGSPRSRPKRQRVATPTNGPSASLVLRSLALDSAASISAPLVDEVERLGVAGAESMQRALQLPIDVGGIDAGEATARLDRVRHVERDVVHESEHT